jgi:hypothetical protein
MTGLRGGPRLRCDACHTRKLSHLQFRREITARSALCGCVRPSSASTSLRIISAQSHQKRATTRPLVSPDQTSPLSSTDLEVRNREVRFTRERTTSASPFRSEKCQYRKYASFDHLVSAGEKHGGHIQIECLGGFQIDDQIEFGRLFYRKLSRLCTA